MCTCDDVQIIANNYINLQANGLLYHTLAVLNRNILNVQLIFECYEIQAA